MRSAEQKHSVLVVEDDEGIRESISDLLVDVGYTPICARNGAEALDRLSSCVRPCVIVLDLMMPVMNGWQFLEHREQQPDLRSIPVIVVSASPSGRPVGAEAFLRKPLDAAAFVELVERHCSRAVEEAP